MVSVQSNNSGTAANLLTGLALGLGASLAALQAAQADTAALAATQAAHVAQAAAANPVFAQVADRLEADRVFVNNVLVAQQQRLNELLAASGAVPSPGDTTGTQTGLYWTRIDDYAAAQRDLMEDYGEFLRLRTIGVFEVLEENTDASSLLFLQTGFIIDTPAGSIDPPQVVEPIPVPEPDIAFPGLYFEAGGFFAATGQ